MKAKKYTLITIICVILSLMIGITAGFFIGKSYNASISNSSEFEFKNDNFKFKIKDVNILKFDYSGLKEAFPYDYDSFTDFPDYLEIEFEFTNLSKNSLIPNDTLELKLFLNGESIDYNTSTNFDWLINSCHYNIDLPSKEYQVGAQTILRKAFKLPNSNFSSDDVIEINLIDKNTSDLLQTLKINQNEFGVKNISLFADLESGKYSYKIVDGDKNG